MLEKTNKFVYIECIFSNDALLEMVPQIYKTFNINNIKLHVLKEILTYFVA